MNNSDFSRYVLGIGAASALLAGCGGSQPPIGAATHAAIGNATPHQKTFSYTGGEQSFTVPSGVKRITVVARGASAIKEQRCDAKGRGGRVNAQIPVTPGERLYVYVGGESGFNGGGSSTYGLTGGGASDVREGGRGLADRILVAGGGGAAGEHSRGQAACGGGGGKIGGPGETDGYSYGGYAGGGGTGGTQTQGGAGGSAGAASGSSSGSPGNPGSLGAGGGGGRGGCYYSQYCSCGYANGCPGGGGGGGYYGGGGGGGGAAEYASIYGDPGGGGGGGSSYVEPRAVDVHFWQNWRNANGDGLIVFSWN